MCWRNLFHSLPRKQEKVTFSVFMGAVVAKRKNASSTTRLDKDARKNVTTSKTYFWEKGLKSQRNIFTYIYWLRSTLLLLKRHNLSYRSVQTPILKQFQWCVYVYMSVIRIYDVYIYIYICICICIIYISYLLYKLYNKYDIYIYIYMYIYVYVYVYVLYIYVYHIYYINST